MYSFGCIASAVSVTLETMCIGIRHFMWTNLLQTRFKGHVTRSNFSCNLQRNKRCVASCKKNITYNNPFCNCTCCVASCKKSRTTLYFSQRSETSCLRVTSSQQLATQFCQNAPIRAYLSLAGDFKMRPPSCCTRCKLRKKLQTCDTPSATWKVFYSLSSVALQVARKIASCNMALSSRFLSLFDKGFVKGDCNPGGLSFAGITDYCMWRWSCPGRTCKAVRCVEVTQNSGLPNTTSLMTTNRVSH